jgi:hypothetical protein
MILLPLVESNLIRRFSDCHLNKKAGEKVGMAIDFHLAGREPVLIEIRKGGESKKTDNSTHARILHRDVHLQPIIIRPQRNLPLH